MKLLYLAMGVLTMLFASPANPQSTDAYHSIQVVPIVADTGTYATRLAFANGSQLDAPIQVRFFPADGTPQPAPLDCPAFTVAVNGVKTFASLRELCPALVSGSNFGYVYAYETSPGPAVFSLHARVSNANGIGFSIEAFPAHVFTGGASAVSSIRRLAATVGEPAYQTNCFVGMLPKIRQGGGESVKVNFTITNNNTGAQIGGSGSVILMKGRVVRLLDVFAAVSAPPGDYEDASIVFWEDGLAQHGIISACTVQENTNFSADFRIGKSKVLLDDHVLRDSQSASYYTSLGAGIGTGVFHVPPGATSQLHVINFRHPDWVQCELWAHGNPYVRTTPQYGLEMRLLSSTGVVIAGGNDVTGFAEVYLGDKENQGGYRNQLYFIQVESNGQREQFDRPYVIRCQSGSGSNRAVLVESGAPVRF